MEFSRYSNLQKEASILLQTAVLWLQRHHTVWVRSCSQCSSASRALAFPASILQCPGLHSHRLGAGCPDRSTKHTLRGLEKAEVKTNNFWRKNYMPKEFAKKKKEIKSYSILPKWHWTVTMRKMRTAWNLLFLVFQFNIILFHNT